MGRHDLASLFAQPGNALRPRFWWMLADITRFNRATTTGRATARSEVSLGAFLAGTLRLAAARLVPAADGGGDLVLPAARDPRFPAADLRALLPQPRAARAAIGPNGGPSRRRADVCRPPSRRSGRRAPRLSGGAHRAAPRRDVDSAGASASVSMRSCWPATATRRCACSTIRRGRGPAAGAVRYQRNRVILHTDASLLPRSRRAWAAWNYLAVEGDQGERPVAVSYLVNKLQPLPFARP